MNQNNNHSKKYNNKQMNKIEKKYGNQQAYLIKKDDNSNGKRTEFLNYVFLDYSESRKMARQIINKINIRKSAIFFNVDPPVDLLKEVSPDVWTNGNITFSIEVFMCKDVVFPEKNNIKVFYGKQKNNENSESVITKNMEIAKIFLK